MEKKILLLNPAVCKTLTVLICALVLSLSCKKENSSGPPPPPPPPPGTSNVSFFSMDGPHEYRQRDTVPDPSIELGLKFKTSIAGKITAIRFWKARGNDGVHTGQLYTTGGSLLASKDFTNETDSGWQQVLFDAPVPIQANTTYVAAYFSSLGKYSSTKDGLKTGLSNSPLSAPADSVEGYNGLFKYCSSPVLPDTSFVSNNYWVDIILNYPNN